MGRLSQRVPYNFPAIFSAAMTVMRTRVRQNLLFSPRHNFRFYSARHTILPLERRVMARYARCVFMKVYNAHIYTTKLS